MATNSEAILWLDGLCDGALDLTADNVGLAKQVRSICMARRMVSHR